MGSNGGEPTEQPSAEGTTVIDDPSERTTPRDDNIRVNKDHPLSTGVTNQIDKTTRQKDNHKPIPRNYNPKPGPTTTQNIETTTSQNLGTPSQNMRTTRQSAHAEPTTRAPSVKPTRTERTPAVTPKAENEKGPWCKYSCMTNGFCKVKWGGVGKTGGGTCSL